MNMFTSYGHINLFTFRPKCMLGSRDPGVNVVNLIEISVMYGYVHWQMTTEFSVMYGSEKAKKITDFFMI